MTSDSGDATAAAHLPQQAGPAAVPTPSCDLFCPAGPRSGAGSLGSLCESRLILSTKESAKLSVLSQLAEFVFPKLLFWGVQFSYLIDNLTDLADAVAGVVTHWRTALRERRCQPRFPLRSAVSTTMTEKSCGQRRSAASH